MRRTCRYLVTLVLSAALLVPAAAALSSGPLSVAFLAGGQWDAALYRGPCGDVGLIDAGNGSSDEVLAQLDAWGDRAALTWINVSHYDSDHLGDVRDVGEAPGVTLDAVYDRGGDASQKDTQTYASYYDWVQPVRQPVDIGDTWTLCTGDQTVTFTVTSAGTDGTAADGVAVTEENDRGVCVLVEHGNFDLASCGDVNGTDDGSRTGVEAAVADAYGDVEVAKVNHHGSQFSSNQTYVDTLRAQVAVVMVGSNSFGHPDPAVLARWDATSDVYQTLNGDGTVADGNITITANADEFTVDSDSTAAEVYRFDEAAPEQEQPAPTARPTDDWCPPDQVPEDGFSDADGNTHEAAIDCVVWWDVANGTTTTTYGPSLAVNRAQMASFIARLVVESGGTLPTATKDHFTDDAGNSHEPNINRLAEADIVGGTGGGLYNPNGKVRRDQMATFLVRAYEFRTSQTLPATADYFQDDDGNPHEPRIDKAAEAGFTGGTASGDYQPAGVVSRAQMASFLARVLDLLVEAGFATVPAARVLDLLVEAGFATVPAEEPSEDCHPSYPDVCIPPPPPDLNCGDIEHRNFVVDHTVADPDPHAFDGNKDGVGCET